MSFSMKIDFKMMRRFFFNFRAIWICVTALSQNKMRSIYILQLNERQSIVCSGS